MFCAMPNLLVVPFDTLVPGLVLGGVVLIIISIFASQAVSAGVRHLISMILNAILIRYFPVKNVEQATDIPSLPYNFPNGQGNVEKFLNGRTNTMKWALEYGSLYRLWSGMHGEVVLTKPEHVEAVFHDSHKHMKAHANDSGYLMECLLGSCLGLISGQSWKAVKSSVEAPFLHRSMGQYATALQDFTSTHIRQLGDGGISSSQKIKLHPVHDLKLMPILFVAKIVYGQLGDDLECELLKLVPVREKLFKTVIGGGITRFALSRFLPFPAIRDLKDFKHRWAQWNDLAHARALKSPRANSAPIIPMYGDVKEGKITRDQLLQTLDEILFANIDVTMGGISWTLVFLAAHSNIQEELRREIHDNSTRSTTENSYLLSSWSTKPTLLGACILEAARLRPLAAFSVPQSCPNSRILDGFEIPAGTNFIIDSYALNIRDSFWGEDRDKFRPDRWLERQKSGRDLRYRYWRFGFGPRNCLGKYLAELLLRAVIVEILKNWDISLDTTAGQQEGVAGNGGGEPTNEDMDWPWDDENWINSPHLLLDCKSLVRSGA